MRHLTNKLTDHERIVLAMVRGVPLGGDETTMATEQDLAAARSLANKGFVHLVEDEGSRVIVTLTERGSQGIDLTS